MVETKERVTPIEARGYAHPEVLVSTEWVAAHLEDPAVRIFEVDEDVLLYEVGHIPGALKLDWVADLNDPVTRDYVGHERLESLLRERGVGDETTLVLYGDKNNWWATYAFWTLRLYGIRNLRIMDGGRARWEAEGRPLVTDVVRPAAGDLSLGERSESGAAERAEARPEEGAIRAFREEVFAHVERRGALVDVRSPEEYRGERLHMAEYPNEGSLRGGHVPGAKNVPWGRAVDAETHLFRSAAELRAIYEGEQGLRGDEEIITYCRIGERSSHTWFVLKYLLGYDRVRNYDGSWTEWGNLVRAPIEK